MESGRGVRSPEGASQRFPLFAEMSRGAVAPRASLRHRVHDIAERDVGVERVAQAPVVDDLVAVPRSDPLALEVPLLDQLGDDSMHRALGDADLLGDVPKPRIRVACKHGEHVHVIGKKEPPGD